MRTPTDAKEARRKEPDCQAGYSEKGSGTGTRAFPNRVENDLECSRGPRGGGDTTGRPRSAAPSPEAPTLPAPGPCVPEAAAWLSSTPRRSPTPPADPRRAAGLQKAGPSAACRSDICSPRRERLRSQPLAAPETAEGKASAAEESRMEPKRAKGRKERRAAERGALA